MTRIVVDARGLPCPQPVLRARQAMEKADAVVTIVDSRDQAENVSRMAQAAGWAVHVDGKEEGIYVHAVRQETLREPDSASEMVMGSAVTLSGPLVLLVPAEHLGRGEHTELGDILMRSFIQVLSEVKPRPDTLVFLNSGVKLVAEGSPVVEDLQELSRQGVTILACGTCLGYYDLKEKAAVGTVTHMFAIAETLLAAGRVVSV